MFPPHSVIAVPERLDVKKGVTALRIVRIARLVSKVADILGVPKVFWVVRKNKRAIAGGSTLVTDFRRSA